MDNIVRLSVIIILNGKMMSWNFSNFSYNKYNEFINRCIFDKGKFHLQGSKENISKSERKLRTDKEMIIKYWREECGAYF